MSSAQSVVVPFEIYILTSSPADGHINFARAYTAAATWFVLVLKNIYHVLTSNCILPSHDYPPDMVFTWWSEFSIFQVLDPRDPQLAHVLRHFFFLVNPQFGASPLLYILFIHWLWLPLGQCDLLTAGEHDSRKQARWLIITTQSSTCGHALPLMADLSNLSIICNLTVTVIYLIASIQSIYLICLSVVVRSARKPYHTTTVPQALMIRPY